MRNASTGPPLWTVVAVLLATVALVAPVAAAAPAPPAPPGPEQSLEARVKWLMDELAAVRAELAELRQAREKDAPLLERLRLSEAQLTDIEKRLVTIYDDGFVFSGADDTLRIGGWLQSDLRLPLSGSGVTSNFFTRRARIDLRGNLEHDFGYRIFTDFTSGAKLQEGWLDYHRATGLRVRMGQMKEPFSLESSYSSLWIDTLEPSLIVSAIQPAEDQGLMIFGRTDDARIEYAAGVFNGVAKNLDDTNDDKDLAARVVARPFDGGMLKQLFLGASVTTGTQADDLTGKSFKTAAGSRFFKFADEVMHTGDRTRSSVELEWLHGPTSVKAEWLQSHLDGLMLDSTTVSADLSGWYVTVTQLLTGENKRRNAAVLPLANFDPSDGEWGAFELVGKYERFNADSALFTSGFATGTDSVSAVTLGLTWWPNRHAKVSLNWVHSNFGDPLTFGSSTSTAEDALLFRHQFIF